MRRRARFALLAKELGELAAQRRTYWLRVLVGLLALWIFWRSHNAAALKATGPFGMLGQGAEIFAPVAWWLLVAILLGIPLLGASAVARERETGSLELLLTSPLGAWSIVLQKYLSRLAMPLSSVAIALPLLAAATALGGVSLEALLLVAVLLASSILVVAALTLAMSAMFRTSGTALIATFALLGAVWTADRVLISGREPASLFQPRALFVVLEHIDVSLRFEASGFEGAWMGPPGRAPQSGLTELLESFTDERGKHLGVAVASWGALTALQVWILLAFARTQLVRADLVRGATWLTRLTRRMEARIREANRSVGGFEIVAWGRGSPSSDPVTWRERPSPTARTRLFVAGQILALMVAVPAILNDRWLEAAIPVAWGAALLLLGLTGARALARERAAGTLPLLVTSPLPAASIVSQKARAQRTWIAIAVATLVTMVCVHAVTRAPASSVRSDPLTRGFVFVAGTCAVLLHAEVAVRGGLLLALWIRGRWLYPAVIGAWGGALMLPGLLGSWMAANPRPARLLVGSDPRWIADALVSLWQPTSLPLYLMSRKVAFARQDLSLGLAETTAAHALTALVAIAAIAAMTRASAARGLADAHR